MQTRRTYTISIKLAWWGCCETVDISPCVQKTFCHAKHRGFFIGPGILSKHPQPQKVGWWVLSEKPGDIRGEENSGTCSQTKVIFKTYINSQITLKKKHYMKFIFNQRSGKNTQLNHSCMLFLPAPAISVHHKDCLSSSTMRACSACGKLNRAAARPYHRTIPGIWPSGKHTKSYWKLPFIVDLPIKNSDFP